jgi:N-acetylmuramoyl-L-alanine amidase
LLLACAGGEWLAAQPISLVRLGRVEFAGHSYVRLGDWARANGFDARWLRTGEVLQLSNRYARLIFFRDLHDMELNGVKVSLSYPIVMRDGGGFISDLDLDTAIGPVLSPPKNWRGAKVRNIVIDPGHGGKDPGNQDGSHQEKKYTLLLAQELSDQLRRAGFNATLTRTSDTFVELPARPDIARRRAADLFISLHWNDLPRNSDFKGSQVYCLTPAGAASSNAGGTFGTAARQPGNRNNDHNMLLAYELQKALKQNLGAEDQGVRRARYWILREATMPAVLIEGGFMSNPGEAKRIYDAGYRRQMAQAIVAGVIAYQRLVE